MCIKPPVDHSTICVIPDCICIVYEINDTYVIITQKVTERKDMAIYQFTSAFTPTLTLRNKLPKMY